MDKELIEYIQQENDKLKKLLIYQQTQMKLLEVQIKIIIDCIMKKDYNY